MEEGEEEEEEVHTVSRDFEDLARHQGYGLPKDAEAQAAITWGGLCPAGGYVAQPVSSHEGPAVRGRTELCPSSVPAARVALFLLTVPLTEPTAYRTTCLYGCARLIRSPVATDSQPVADISPQPRSYAAVPFRGGGEMDGR